MDGYVMNNSPTWKHAMKRSVRPGGQITLDELFEQYGVKHELNEGREFVEWLREVKLRDKNLWKIVLEDEDLDTGKILEPVLEEVRRNDNVAPIVGQKMQVNDIVNLSVRKARELVPTISDLNLLKYSIQEANQMANKDSLCKVLRKRIKELQIAR